MRRMMRRAVFSALFFGAIGMGLPTGRAAEAPERLTGSLTDGGGVAADLFKTVEQGTAAGRANPDEGKKFPRPVIVPLPAAIDGVASPVISLDGTWKFTLKPPKAFWSNNVDPAKWSDIAVPGEAAMQGFPIVLRGDYDKEFPYKRAMEIPADFKGKRIFLRFEGVYTYARVWVNGQFVRDHHGGFTPWTCEITDLVKPGQTAWLTVGVSDAKLDEYINNMSSYAQHSLLGITRSVKLFAVPADHATRFHVETDFDASFVNATLKTTCAMAFKDAKDAEVRLSLKDPKGLPVALSPAAMTLSPDKPEMTLSTPVAAPSLWDAEHPNLYTLEARVLVGGAEVQTLTKKIGFRKVELKDRQILVNGRVVKLRGLGTMPVHPLTGRTLTRAMSEAAIRMYKQANVNYLRLACYPQGPEVYDLCNELGMYLEDDAPLVHDAYDAPKTPDHIALSTWAEQIEENRSHPSIILWEAGNESPIGTKIPKMIDYLKREDQTRPFVWPSYNASPGPEVIFDHHYPAWNTRFGGRVSPTIYNEFAHVADYCVHTIKRDPNIRNYWGISVRKMWEGMYPAAGCLGGTIWAAIDDVFHYPPPQELKERKDKQSQGGEWGIIDGWRRAKPEYWLTKKAFSPVRVKDAPVALPAAGEPLPIPVTNWFDHANLGEVAVRWAVAGDSGKFQCPNAPPGGGVGTLSIPARSWKAGEVLNLKFDWGGMTVDEYNLPIGGEPRKVFPAAAGPAPKVTEDTASITVAGKDFALAFSKATGKITAATYGGTSLIEGGPELNLAPVSLSGWSLSSLTHATTATQAILTIAGSYAKVEIEGWKDKVQKGKDKAGHILYHEKPAGPVGVVFVVKIDGQGLISTDFTIANPPPPNASQYGNTGYDEVGITYILPATVDRISWDRKALWSAYPEDHIGRPRGTAMRAGRVPVYRQEPTWPWSQDEKTFYYFGAEDPGGRGSNDFRSSKENVWFYSAQLAGSNKRVRVESDSTVAVRAEVVGDGRVELRINTVLGYPALQWGNYCPIATIASGYIGRVNLRLTDNDPGEGLKHEFQTYLGNRSDENVAVEHHDGNKLHSSCRCRPAKRIM